MTRLTAGQCLLRSTANPAWLPPGSTAHVIAAGPGEAAPTPTCLVRVLLTHGESVLVVPRPDGQGLDIPSMRVEDATPNETVRSLLNDFVGADRQASLLGYVMNMVERPTDDYPWPTPYAHFTVWRVEIDNPTDARGTWLGPEDAHTHLGQRHWWPLHRQIGEIRRPQAHGPSGATELLDQVLNEELPRYAEALERLGH